MQECLKRKAMHKHEVKMQVNSQETVGRDQIKVGSLEGTKWINSKIKCKIQPNSNKEQVTIGKEPIIDKNRFSMLNFTKRIW